MQAVAFCDQRRATDEQFLEHLRLPGASGRRLGVARKTGDAAQAVRIVATHFRTRARPCWPFYMHGTAWLERNNHAKVLDKAQALLRHRFQSSWPPYASVDLGRNGGVDWGKGLAQLSGNISRNTFVPELTTAFSLTGDVVYLHKAWGLIRSFVRAHPFVLDPHYLEDPDRTFGYPPNGAGELALRAARWLDFMHSGALQVPGVMSDREVFWFMKQGWFYAMQMYRLCGDTMRRDNHHLGDHGYGPYLLGVMFPEFSVARALEKQGRQTFLFHVESNLFDDGGYAEHCTKYQYHIFYSYAAGLALAQANGTRLFSAAQEARLAKWAQFLARACKPDGILVEYGDEFGAPLAHFFSTLTAPVLSPGLAAVARALGYTPGRACIESPARLARFFGKWTRGQPPRIGLSSWFDPAAACQISETALPRGSAQYKHSGFTFFRGGWDKQADFLSVAHYTDSLPHSHTHWDMMSFVLHTQGQTLIGDPATWLYGVGSPELRGYAYSVDAHNCLVMDDDTLKPLKALSHRCCWGGYPPRHGLGIFKAGGPIEVAELWHDAYAPTRHRRYSVHLNGIGFALVDLLSRPGLDLRPHQYSQRFHFEGDVRIFPGQPGRGHPLAATREGASCLIVPGREADTDWKSWHDERLVNTYGVPRRKVKGGPWVAELTRCIEGPSVFTSFILTRAAKSFSGLRYLGSAPAQRTYQQHDGVSAHRLDLGAGGTVLLASCPYGKTCSSAEFSTDAELAVAILDTKGAVRHWALARGSRLTVNGKKLTHGRKRWAASA